MTIILTDVDDTVLQFSHYFQNWAMARGLIADGHVREHCDIGRVFGINDDECWNLIEEFYRDPIFAEIAPEPDALEVIPRLHREGFKFVAITACADDSNTIEARKRNLRNAFGFDWLDVHCTGVNQSKRSFLHSYEPTIWVEDNFGNAVLGAEIGHTSIVLDRPYNRHFSDSIVKRMPDWRAVDEAFFKAQIL